jgi:fused-like protein
MCWSGRRSSVARRRVYGRQVLDALCYLDENRITHRDLKPQNILIQNEVIKICDFGFARKLSASTTFMNSLKGTPLYIAPEILAVGPLNYTKRVDVWSFGIIIYELFTGRPPFWAENLARLKLKILNEKVRFPRRCPSIYRH